MKKTAIAGLLLIAALVLCSCGRKKPPQPIEKTNHRDSAAKVLQITGLQETGP